MYKKTNPPQKTSQGPGSAKHHSRQAKFKQEEAKGQTTDTDKD